MATKMSHCQGFNAHGKVAAYPEGAGNLLCTEDFHTKSLPKIDRAAIGVRVVHLRWILALRIIYTEDFHTFTNR